MGDAGKVARLLLLSSIFSKLNDYFFLAFLEGMNEQALLLTNEVVCKLATIAGKVLHNPGSLSTLSLLKLPTLQKYNLG